MSAKDIYPINDRLLVRSDKELMISQKSRAYWFCGLSGSGKSTLAIQLEKDLHNSGIFSLVLDGDNLRDGLNQDLGFSDTDRMENIRRVSEVAKILVSNGLVVIVSLISPKKEFRELAREIIGSDSFREIYIQANFETCHKRDVKGLYAKAEKNQIKDFTGKSSAFVAPLEPWIRIDTANETISKSSQTLFDKIIKDVQI
jgi:adenylylsulfate kinase